MLPEKTELLPYLLGHSRAIKVVQTVDEVLDLGLVSLAVLVDAGSEESKVDNHTCLTVLRTLTAASLLYVKETAHPDGCEDEQVLQVGIR